MTGLLLRKFSNKISDQILNDFFPNLTTVSFNAGSDVSNTTYFITATNVGNTALYNNNIIRYYTGTGGTIISGLSNGHLYKVSSANSVGFKLANVTSNATIALISGNPETHYFATFNPSYYFALSKHSPWDDESTPDTPFDNISSVRDFQREMILGKRLNRADMAYMIRKITWTSGVVYSHYDDTDENLFDKNFYVLAADSSNVYKCLDNNNGSPSTVKPTGKLTTRFQTADGYIWKYMYTLSTANNTKFSTSEFIPVDTNTSITSAAVNGAIEVVQITTAGSGYSYAAGFIQEVVSNTVFRVETSSTQTSNDYYNTSGFYVDAGTGAGQLTIVSDYVVNTSGHYIITANNIDSPALDTTSEYIISPQIKFSGDGIGLKAYANVESGTGANSIISINILNRGQDYSYCVGQVISLYGSGATIRPVLSPEGGHGYNQPAELGASYLCVSTDFANNESTLVSTNPTFRKTGIIFAPKQFSNTQLYYSNSVFNALYKMTATIVNPSVVFEEGETIRGLTSNAQGIVAWANTSYLEFSYKYGTFLSSEQVIGETSKANATITSINTPDIHKYDNEVVYYDYVLPIQRSNTQTETAKLLIAI